MDTPMVRRCSSLRGAECLLNFETQKSMHRGMHLRVKRINLERLLSRWRVLQNLDFERHRAQTKFGKCFGWLSGKRRFDFESF